MTIGHSASWPMSCCAHTHLSSTGRMATRFSFGRQTPAHPYGRLSLLSSVQPRDARLITSPNPHLRGHPTSQMVMFTHIVNSDLVLDHILFKRPAQKGLPPLPTLLVELIQDLLNPNPALRPLGGKGVPPIHLSAKLAQIVAGDGQQPPCRRAYTPTRAHAMSLSVSKRLNST